MSDRDNEKIVSTLVGEMTYSKFNEMYGRWMGSHPRWIVSRAEQDRVRKNEEPNPFTEDVKAWAKVFMRNRKAWRKAYDDFSQVCLEIRREFESSLSLQGSPRVYFTESRSEKMVDTCIGEIRDDDFIRICWSWAEAHPTYMAAHETLLEQYHAEYTREKTLPFNEDVRAWAAIYMKGKESPRTTHKIERVKEELRETCRRALLTWTT